MTFTLDLLADRLPEEDAKRLVVQQARDFGSNYFYRHPEKQGEKELDLLFEALVQGRFWYTLNKIDGPADTSKVSLTGLSRKPFTKEEIEETRTWANANFVEAELQELFDISVNYALLVPKKSGAPGSVRGHIILYKRLFGDFDSIFSAVATDDFRVQLNNGRFWEAIPDSSYIFMDRSAVDASRALEDILTNHYDDLDLGFVPKGISFLYRGRLGPDFADFDITSLSEPAIDRYWDFIKRVESEVKSVNSEDIENLVCPYALAVISTERYDDIFIRPRFEEGPGSWRTRLKDKDLRRHIRDSDKIRNKIAESLSINVLDYDVGDYVIKVCLQMPRPKDMFARVLNNLIDYDVPKLAKIYEGKSDLDNLLTAETRERLETAGKKRR